MLSGAVLNQFRTYLKSKDGKYGNELSMRERKEESHYCRFYF